MTGSEAHTPGASADVSLSPLQALGHHLRQAREERGLRCSELAGQLRMGEEQLLALESGDHARLPEMVFVIAQARRVADALNCDITELLAPLKQQSNAIKPAPAPLSAPPQRPGRERRSGRITAQNYTHKPTRASSKGGLRWLGSLALLAGLIAAGSWGWQHRSQLRLPSARIPSSPAKPAAPPSSQRAQTKTTPQQTPAQLPSQLTLRAVQPSWLEVRTGTGKQLFEGTFKGERRFPLQGGLQLLAGRPDLVRVSLGDKPAQPLGRIDQIRWITFKAPTR